MSLVQHWKCQDNAASTTVVATVGTNGTLAGGDNTSTISTVDGPGTAFPRSLELDGTNDYIDISGSSLSFAAGSAWSVAAWARATNFSAQRSIIGVTGASTPRIQVQFSTQVRTTMTSGDNAFTVSTISDDAWHHYLITKSSSDVMRVFIDGVESSTGGITVAQTFAPTCWGRTNAFRMLGNMCDLRIYDSDESANVAAIMAEKDTASAPGNLSYYSFLAGGPSRV